MYSALSTNFPDPSAGPPADNDDDLLDAEDTDMNGHDYDLIGCPSCLPKDRFLGILVPATSAAPISVTSASEAQLIEDILNECERQLRELETKSPALEHPGFGIDDVFAGFWSEFTAVVRDHPECHFQLTRFLHGFLEVVEHEGKPWFSPREKLGRELLEKNLKYWLEEVGNNVLEVLKQHAQDDDSALDDIAIQSYVNYFTFLALLVRENALEAWPKLSSVLYDSLKGYSFEQRPWRDAALLAWEKTLSLVGHKAFEEFRDEWNASEQNALEIVRDASRRLRVRNAAAAVADTMKSIREQAEFAASRRRQSPYG